MIGDVATGGLASGVGSFISGLFGGGGIGFHDQKKLMEKQKYRDWETDRKSTRLNSSHITRSRMPSSA